MLKNILSKILPPPLRGGSIFFIAVVMLFAGCASGLRVNSAVSLNREKLLLSTEGGNSEILYYSNTVLSHWLPGKEAPFGEIVSLDLLNDGAVLAITEKNGIVVFPDAQGKPVHLAIDDNKLPDHRIRNTCLYQFGKIKKLYVTYYSPGGTGVTECTIKNNWKDITYNTLNRNGSGLRSNYVHQVVPDIRGNIWFRYSASKKEGVSRLNLKGEWDHFDRRNSELGDNGVILIRPEKRGMGQDGDNIWFVSGAGLSRLQYRGKKENWKLFGDKSNVIDTMARAIGIQSWFTDAIVDIVDIEILDDAILIANKEAIYHFKGKNINRFLPETTGGINEHRIFDIKFRAGTIIAKIHSAHEPNPPVRSVMLFDLEKRRWKKLEYFHLANQFPRNIYFIPYNEKQDFVVLKYVSGPSRLAIFDYVTGGLREIKPSFER